jgi:hypothetical protein
MRSGKPFRPIGRSESSRRVRFPIAHEHSRIGAVVYRGAFARLGLAVALATTTAACTTERVVSTGRTSSPPSDTLVAPTSSASRTHEQLLADPGTADHQCVDVDDLRARHAWRTVPEPNGQTASVLDVRSGEIVAGNFYDLSGTDHPGDPAFSAKIYWIPLDPTIAKTNPLTLTITDLDNTSTPATTLHLGGDGTASMTVDRYYFWPSGTPLPHRGRWRITAEAPPEWGCFELTV